MNINISVAKDSEFKEYYAIRCEKIQYLLEWVS